MNNINDIKSIKNKLNSKGYKLTAPRYKIISIIYNSKKHMNIDEIYGKLKCYKVGLCTVYRNLKLFEEVGILRRININNINYYELEKTDDNRVHVHIECKLCNELIDVNEEEVLDNLKKLVSLINKKYNIQIESSSLILSSVCGECNKR